VRLTLYGADVPSDGPVDCAVRDWLLTLRPLADPGAGLRPVHRLELLAEGRTAVDVIAGLFDWGDISGVGIYYRGLCRSDGRTFVLRRYTFDAVPPTCALPYFHPEEDR
jgi:hypothetical protein